MDGSRKRLAARQASGALLTGKLFDADGRTMTPTHAQKGSRRYLYYVTRALGGARCEDRIAGARRVSAPSDRGKHPGRAAIGAALDAIALSAGASHLQDTGTTARRSSLQVRPERARSARWSEAAVSRVTLVRTRSRSRLTSDAAAAMGRTVLHLGWSAVSQYSPSRDPGTDRWPASGHADACGDTRDASRCAGAVVTPGLDDLLTSAMPDIDAIAVREAPASARST